ncbi:MAG: hypothetical protein HYT11_03795, partial [Candidatus Levybacteria bacterium]|nr:hypothetical protein [Candidatus Levybacteria bacterium]
MSERGKIIMLPLDRARKPIESHKIEGRLIQFPQNRVRKPREDGNGKVQFNYYGIEIGSIDELLDDSRLAINGVLLGEYLEDHQRALLDHPEANARFVDSTLTRVFYARCAYVGQMMGEQEAKRVLREIAARTLDKADTLESADQLRESVFSMWQVAFGAARAGRILERRELERAELVTQDKAPQSRKGHLTIIKKLHSRFCGKI